LHAARTAATPSSPTIPATTSIAHSARGAATRTCMKTGRPCCCRRPTSTSSLCPRQRRHRLHQQALCDLLFRALAETIRTIAADSSHPGRQDRHHVGAAHLGLGHDTSPACAHDRAGGGLSAEMGRIAARPNFFLPVLVLSNLFRRLMLEKLVCCPQGRQARLLGHACAPGRGLPGAAEEDALVRPLQAAFRRDRSRHCRAKKRPTCSARN